MIYSRRSHNSPTAAADEGFTGRHVTATSRRSFLQLVGTGAAVALLSGCTTHSKAKAGGALAAERAGLKLPSYLPFTKIKPDLPGSPDGLDPVYLSFPKTQPTSVSAAPATGKSITALGWTDSVVPPPVGSNSYWQELNRRLGADFDLTIATDYPTKFNTTIAGGDIPELVWFPPNQGLTHVEELLEAKFLDLTSYLSGDAIASYPNLANLGDFCWRTTVIDGKIWGPAVSHGAFGQILECNKAHWDEVGGTDCKDSDEFLGKLKQLTSAKAKRWAMEPLNPNPLKRFGDFFGVPVNWALEGGKLTYYLETDAFQQALEFTVTAARAGVFYPDQNADQYEVLFPQKQVSTIVDDMAGFLAATKKYKAVDPSFEISGVVPFNASPQHHALYALGYGSLGFTAISKHVTDRDRVKMLLRVLDYFAAPFGSQEYLFLHFGSEGVHHTADADGNPQLTKKGQTETSLNDPIGYLSQGPEVIYQGTEVAHAKYLYATQQRLLAIGKSDPTLGHYSPTQNNDSSKLPAVNDELTDILLGRKPVSHLETLRKEWRAQGGDKIRGEYEASIAAAGTSSGP